MENPGQSQEVSTAFVKFDQKNQENTLEIGDLFSQLQLKDSDIRSYEAIKNAVADIRQALEDFHTGVDEKILVSDIDKGQTFQGASVVQEGDFDAEIRNLQSQLDQKLKSFQETSSKDFAGFAGEIKGLLNVDSFVAKQKPDTSVGAKWLAVGGGYKVKPEPSQDADAQKIADAAEQKQGAENLAQNEKGDLLDSIFRARSGIAGNRN